jgi:AcrR family transcriptional regulator
VVDDNQTHGQRVKADILAAGVTLWRGGAECVTARAIGRALDMTHSAVLYHFDNAAALKDAVAAHAVAVGDTVVVPLLIVSGHQTAAVLGEAERRRYLADC